MSLVKDGQGPYAPKAAVLKVIEAFRERSPRTPMTVDNISLIDGVSESIAPRTLQAMKLLDLLTAEGEPTPALLRLKEAGRNEYPVRLAEVVKEAYADIFAYHDPTTADPADIQDAFRVYRPSSMRDRMVRLFYGLCEASSIIGAAPRVESGTPSQKATRPKADSDVGDLLPARMRKVLRGSAAPPPPPPPPAPSSSAEQLKLRYIELLMDRLQNANGEFDTDLADRIERLMDAAPTK